MEIKDIVFQILQKSKTPLKARHIVSILNSEFDIKINTKEVNKVLYYKLKGIVKRDPDEHTYYLRNNKAKKDENNVAGKAIKLVSSDSDSEWSCRIEKSDKRSMTIDWSGKEVIFGKLEKDENIDVLNALIKNIFIQRNSRRSSDVDLFFENLETFYE